MLKRKYHIQLPAVLPAQVPGHIRGDKHRLPHGKGIVLVQHPPQLPEDLVVALLGQILLHTGEHGPLFPAGQALLPQHVDHVAAEAGHALVQPEAHDVLDLLQDSGVVVIQIRLLLGKQMQVVFAPLHVELPAVAAEKAGPVVGQAAVAVAPGPVVIAGVGAVPLPAPLEPGVLRGGVVDDQVHDDADVPSPGLPDEPLHVLHGSVFRVDGPVVADIIPVVHIGGAVDRAEPDGVHAQLLQITQAADDARYIANPVAVGILKAPGIDLVDDRVLPPFHYLSFLPFCSRLLFYDRSLVFSTIIGCFWGRSINPFDSLAVRGAPDGQHAVVVNGTAASTAKTNKKRTAGAALFSYWEFTPPWPSGPPPCPAAPRAGRCPRGQSGRRRRSARRWDGAGPAC